jgi:hypothetical protein
MPIRIVLVAAAVAFVNPFVSTVGSNFDDGKRERHYSWNPISDSLDYLTDGVNRLEPHWNCRVSLNYLSNLIASAQRNKSSRGAPIAGTGCIFPSYSTYRTVKPSDVMVGNQITTFRVHEKQFGVSELRIGGFNAGNISSVVQTLNDIKHHRLDSGDLIGTQDPLIKLVSYKSIDLGRRAILVSEFKGSRFSHGDIADDADLANFGRSAIPGYFAPVCTDNNVSGEPHGNNGGRTCVCINREKGSSCKND